MSISDGELARYDEDGAVVIDTPFSSAELDRGEAAWDRLKVSGDWIDTDPDLVDMIQHPFMEEVARMVLRANGVHLWWSLSTHARPPWTEAFDSEAEQWASGAHADIQATLEDFEATPRRMRAELWLWLNDAPVDRGAMRVLPGSHREIMAHWSRVLTDEHKAQLGDKAAVLLIADTGGKAAVAAGVTADLAGTVSAVDLVRAAVAELGGKGGGGRPDMAQGGGPSADNAEAAIAAAEKVLEG